MGIAIRVVTKIVAVGGAIGAAMAPLFPWLQLSETPPGQFLPIEIVGIDLIQGKASLFAGLGLMFASIFVLFDDAARRTLAFRIFCGLCIAALMSFLIALGDPQDTYLSAFLSKLGQEFGPLDPDEEMRVRLTGWTFLMCGGIVSGLSMLFAPRGRPPSDAEAVVDTRHPSEIVGERPHLGTAATIVVAIAALIVASGLMLRWDTTFRLIILGDIGLPVPTALHGLSFPGGRALLLVTAGGGFAIVCWACWKAVPPVGILVTLLGVVSLSSGLVATQTIETGRDDALEWEWRTAYGGSPTGGLAIAGASAEEQRSLAARNSRQERYAWAAGPLLLIVSGTFLWVRSRRRSNDLGREEPA